MMEKESEVVDASLVRNNIGNRDGMYNAIWAFFYGFFSSGKRVRKIKPKSWQTRKLQKNNKNNIIPYTIIQIKNKKNRRDQIRQ